MTEPFPFDDTALDRLLARDRPPPLGAGFADRVVAEARRADRVPTPKPVPPTRRPVRRWTRRGIWASVVAVNLIVASAIAATFSGGQFHLARVVAVVTHALHLPHHEAPAPHRAPAVHELAAAPRPQGVAPPPAMPLAAAAPLIALVPAARPLAIAQPTIGQPAPRLVARPTVRPERLGRHIAAAPHLPSARARRHTPIEPRRPPAVVAERPVPVAPSIAAPVRETERAPAAARTERQGAEAPRAQAAANGRWGGGWRARAQTGQGGGRPLLGWRQRQFAGNVGTGTADPAGGVASSGAGGNAPAEAANASQTKPEAWQRRQGAGAGKAAGPKKAGGGRRRFGRGRRF